MEDLTLNDESFEVANWRSKFELKFPDPQTIKKNAFRIYDDRYIQRQWLGYLDAKKEDAQHIKNLEEQLQEFICISNGISMYIRSDMFGKSGNQGLNGEIQKLYDHQCEVENYLSPKPKEVIHEA